MLARIGVATFAATFAPLAQQSANGPFYFMMRRYQKKEAKHIQLDVKQEQPEELKKLLITEIRDGLVNMLLFHHLFL